MDADMKNVSWIIRYIVTHLRTFDLEAVLFIVFKTFGISSREDQAHLRGILEDVSENRKTPNNFMQELTLVTENPGA